MTRQFALDEKVPLSIPGRTNLENELYQIGTGLDVLGSEFLCFGTHRAGNFSSLGHSWCGGMVHYYYYYCDFFNSKKKKITRKYNFG